MARNCKTAFNASIINGAIYFEDALQCNLLDELAADILDDVHLRAIRLISLSANWQLSVWLSADTKITENIKFEMTLRKEKRGQQMVWYAYRRVFGTLHKRYVGHSQEITEQKLLDLAQRMPSS